MPGYKDKVLLLERPRGAGTNKDLGFQMLADLLEALANRENRPKTIICLNTAVKLASKSHPLLRRLKRLEELGVDILVGQGCWYELELGDKTAVGKLVGMHDVLDVLFQNDVITI